MTSSGRTALAALLLAVAVVGAFAGPVAAGHGGSTPENSSTGESHGEIRATENSTVELHQALGLLGDGGWLLVDCEGDFTLHHECDKGGELDAGPASVDYDGYNYGNPPALYGGGGDEVTVTAGNRSAAGEFDCDLRPSELPQACTVNGSSSETGGTSLP
jgi:hypothetical protein